MTMSPPTRSVPRSTVRLAAVAVSILGLATASALPATAQQNETGPAGAPVAQSHPKSDKGLGEADRVNVAAAQRNGKPTVTLLVAAKRDRSSAAADQLRALGGVVLKTDDAVDYLKVEIPTGKAEEAAKLDAVEA